VPEFIDEPDTTVFWLKAKAWLWHKYFDVRDAMRLIFRGRIG
jgi:hypothetical protein